MPLIEIDSPVLAEINAYALSFKAREGLSYNPHYLLEIACPYADVEYSRLLGELVCVCIEQANGGSRPFYGYIVGGMDAGQHHDQYVYSLELSSWLWFLQQNHNSRIFQALDVLQIVEKVLSRYSPACYRLDISGHYPQREYCVQFAETDFAFVSRLLESEGIWYYIEHLDGQHQLVITDKQSFTSLPEGYQELPFLPDSEDDRAIREGIQRIYRTQKVHPNEVVLRDFDYLHPRKNLQTSVQQENSKALNMPLEWYDYAAGYDETTRGEQLARLRLEAMQVQGQYLSGCSNALGLEPGKCFSLILHPDAQRNRCFKIIHCDYDFVQDGPDSSGEGRQVSCRFRALHDDAIYRPERKTPRPQMPGLQSATVVGAPNSEVHTDKHARIRVHFHWDRYSTNQEDSSCWIRVAQAWAGKGWGVVAMPRVGQEVLVTYVDGDFDRPLVTGVVYNGDCPPPYQLPDQINYTGIVSRSLLHGRPQHASQLTFDDKRDNERVILHAERDLHVTVERNLITDIDGDKYDIIKDTFTDWFNNHVSYKDYIFSITGFSASATGINASTTGFSLSHTGVSTSFTGMNTSFTGVGTSFTGVSTSFTGMSSSMTGMSNGCTGVSNTMTGLSNSFTGISNSLTGMSNSFTTSSHSVVGNSISFTGMSTSTVGSSTSMVGSSMSTTGSSISTTGSSVSTTGSSVSQTGNSVSKTGSSMSNTGSSISETGNSVSRTGSSVSETGCSISRSQASMSDSGVDLKKVGMQSKN